jgi:hypothetical protein
MQKVVPENLAARLRTILLFTIGSTNQSPFSQTSATAHSVITEGIFLAERIFGVTIVNSDEQRIPVR